MIKGVLFGDIHSLTDWNCALKKKPNISPPMAKTTYINVPGMDGSLDLTEALGSIKYDMRTITMEFMYLGKIESWAFTYSKILNAIQGKQMQITLDDDPRWYYIGRAQISQWDAGRHFSDFTITALVQPHKVSYITYDEWLWDTFNFEEDVAIDREYDINDTDYTEINVFRMNVPLTVIIESDVDATVIFPWSLETHNISANTPTTFNTLFPVGLSTMRAKSSSGEGKITIDYSQGEL